MKKDKSISDLVTQYFKKHPKKELSHGHVVDWVEAQYKKLYNKKPRDTWRSIRHLHQEGILIKVEKGIYKFDPDFMKKPALTYPEKSVCYCDYILFRSFCIFQIIFSE